MRRALWVHLIAAVSSFQANPVRSVLRRGARRFELSSGGGPDQFENPNEILQTLIQSAPMKFSEGRRIKYGVFSEEVSPDDLSEVTEDARTELRAAAAATLTNIDDDERQRRTLSGYAGFGLTALLAVALTSFHAGFVPRLSLFPFVVLSYAYIQSGRVGLWNIAQDGLWDVDGTGMQKIDDPTLARALLDKVNAFNLGLLKDDLWKLALPVLVFASASALQ